MRAEYYWDMLGRDQGQIIDEMYPQLHGAAEEAGELPDVLHLTHDHTDDRWYVCARREVEDEWTVIWRGRKTLPTVAAACAARTTWIAQADWKKHGWYAREFSGPGANVRDI